MFSSILSPMSNIRTIIRKRIILYNKIHQKYVIELLQWELDPAEQISVQKSKDIIFVLKRNFTISLKTISVDLLKVYPGFHLSSFEKQFHSCYIPNNKKGYILSLLGLIHFDQVKLNYFLMLIFKSGQAWVFWN